MDGQSGNPMLVDTAGLVRRARRLADLSQRDLAAAIGISPARVARIETGGSVDVSTFAHILALAGLSIAILDESGAEVAAMPREAPRDRSGRRLPAHLDAHAVPERRTIRELFRQADPSPTPLWHHQRPERDRLRRQTGRSSTDEQLRR